MANVIVYLGPAHAGKTHELVRQYLATLRQSPAGESTLWIAPNNRTVETVRLELLAAGLEACFNPGILTFDRLTQIILDDAARPRHLVGPVQRELLRRLTHRAAESGKLQLFASAAERAGFIDLLCEHVEELQRRGISPDAYSKARPQRGDAAQHNELAYLYFEYIRTLSQHNLFDIETAHAAAHDALANGTCRRYEKLELVVVDGFTDFTHTQHDTVRLLAERSQRLFISLPSDRSDPPALRTDRSIDVPAGADVSECQTNPSGRTDLFAKTTATLAELRRRHPQLQLQSFERRSTTWPAADFLAENVFRQPGRTLPPSDEVLDSLGRLEIISAAGAHAEILEIARRIKYLLTAGDARPDHIVVVFRTLTDAAHRVREVFDEFGIPYHLGAQPRLIAAPLLRTFLALLRLDLEDWPFRRVVALVTNTALTTIDATSRRATDWLVRDLQIAQGRAKLLERVAQLASSEPQNQPDYFSRRVESAKQATAALKTLSSALDHLPEQATLTQWFEALGETASNLGFFPSNTSHSSRRLTNTSTTGIDQSAWRCLERHLLALEQLEAQLGQPARSWSRRELFRVLLDIATHESLPAEEDDVGRVLVLSAPAARNISVRHLFMAGMSEQAFPASERTGRLASNSDYQYASLIADRELAATQPSAPTRSQDEMLLFYEVLSRAQESLTISYPALDDKAQSLPPSPYVLEIERIVGEKGAAKLRRLPLQLSPVPREAAPFSPADWRIAAVARALEDDHRLLAGYLSSSPSSISMDAGIRIVYARAHGESFGPAEGLIMSASVAKKLAKRYGSKHLWSPSQWESYAACPYKFFLQSVLKLEPLGDLVLETDFARRGSRLHHVLAKFHRQWSEARDGGPSEANDATAFTDHLRKVIDECINVTSRSGLDAALLELDRRQLQKWADDHFDHHRKYDSTCRKLRGALSPSHFEFRFGPPRPGEDASDPESVPKAFELKIDGETIRVVGQIDRVDAVTIDGRTYFCVLDYKSGRKVSLKPEHIESGERLQLPIYVEAAQMLLFEGNATPLAAGYWSMATGFDAKGALAVESENPKRWEDLSATVRRRVREFVDGIRRGEFPVFSRDDQCTSTCEFNTVCRVAQVRSLKKSWPSGASGLAEDTPQSGDT